MKTLPEEYDSVFAKPKHLRPARGFDHMIPLIPGAKPINIRPYKSSFVHKKEIEVG